MSVDEQFLANDLTQPSDAFTVSAIREQLTVEKRLVETGAIRVRKLVHEDLVTVNTPLTGEIAKINRIKFDTVVTGPVPIRHEGDVIERLDLSSGEWRIVKDDPSTQNS